MDERRNIIKKDYTKLGSIHFSANMRRMIDAIPGLMGKTEFVHMDFTERKAIETFIENFILFAISLNITTVAQMVMFCVPRSTYNSALIKHENEPPKYNSLMNGQYFKESVDVKNVKSISESYVTECCLLKTNNMLFKSKIPFNINMRNIVFPH